MAKIIFVAFAIEDERSRDFLKGQSLLTKSPFEYVDMSVKEAYTTDWKEKVRARIKRSDGVIALVSKNSLTSAGQLWEIQCAKEEGIPIIGLRISSTDLTSLTALSGYPIIPWTWEGIKNFIDAL